MNHPFDDIVSPFTARKEFGGIKHAMNLLSMESDAVELGDGCTLRHATDEEASSLSLIFNFSAGAIGMNRPKLWTNKIIEDGQRVHAEPLETHRFYVVYHEDNGASAHQLERASILAATPELHLGPGIHWAGTQGTSSIPTGFSGLGPGAQRWLSEKEFGWHEGKAKAHELTAAAASDLKSVYSSLWAKFGDPWSGTDSTVDSIDLQRALRDYLTLRDVPQRMPLKFLGYFGILESLVTRKPSPSDPYSSIIKQVTNKTKLVSNRLIRDISLPAPVKLLSWKKLWSAMYELRSCYAHGRSPDFGSKPLSLLNSHNVASDLLVDLVRSLMRQVLEEPQLMTDLRSV